MVAMPSLGQIRRIEFTAIFSSRTSVVMALLIGVAVMYWLWFGLFQRSIQTDDGISIQAAQGILEYGYQQMPSGFLYERGYIQHYILAASIGLLGLNAFSVILPSLIMAAGTLWLTYLIARDVFGRPWLGIISGVVLLVLELQSFYATSPRMYEALQVFTLLAVYSAWRATVMNDNRFRFLTFAALAGAMLSHQQGMIVLAAVAASILAVLLLYRRKPPSIMSVQNALGVLLVFSVIFFIFGFESSSPMPAISDFAGMPPGSVALNLNSVNWAQHIFQLERALPYGLSLWPVMLALVAMPILRGGKDTRGMTYLFLVFGIAASLTVMSTDRHAERFWFFVLPIYSIMLTYSGSVLVSRFLLKGRGLQESNLPGNLILAPLLVVGIIVNLGFVSFAEETTHLELATQGYGLACVDTDCDRAIGEHYAFLREQVGEGDLIISTNPFVTHFYLGRVDGYLREKSDGKGGFLAFDEPTDEYNGIPLIDTGDEIDELLSREQRVWIILDSKTRWAVSEDAVNALKDGMYLFRVQGPITTLTNCIDQPCGGAGSD